MSSGFAPFSGIAEVNTTKDKNKIIVRTKNMQFQCDLYLHRNKQRYNCLNLYLLKKSFSFSQNE